MRKILFAAFLLSSSVSFSQVRLGLFGGVSNYQGDMIQGAYVARFTKPAIGITGSYPISDRFALRAGFTYGKVAGDDKYNVESVRTRNLNFETKITEFALLGEFTVFSLDNIRWSPYVFGGVAVYHFNPYTEDSSGNRIFLQPLGTEGQGIDGYDKPYSLTQLALPFGGGVKYAISDRVQLGLEVGLRKTFTDYLDDVSTNYADEADLLAAKGPLAVELSYRTDELPGGSQAYPAKGAQRGGAKEKDWYYFSGLHLTFALGEGGGGFLGGGRGKRGYGCPSVPL